MKSRISLIVVVSENGGIGHNNELLYHLPADLRHFRELTTGHVIIMGRNTFESLPKGALPQRRNLVLSTQPGSFFSGAEHFVSLQDALENCKEEEEVFIIGGGSVYAQALPICQRIYMTRVAHWSKEATVFFPVLDETEWQIISEESHPADEKNPYPYQFITLEKKK